MSELQPKILGKVKGLCACYSEATLNGRPYDKIYKDILAGKNYFYNEMIQRGGILCEFGHPAQASADFERTDTDLEKACVLIQKITETKKGELTAEGVILDTPAGRIYKAIAPLYKFGFSSRGSYEADSSSTEGPDGWNQDSYIFKGFDIVALPANEGSTISVTESVKGNRKSAREALDINRIADAADVDEEEIENELDKIFDDDGEVADAKRVNLRDVPKKDSKTKETEETETEETEETEEIETETEETETEETETEETEEMEETEETEETETEETETEETETEETEEKEETDVKEAEPVSELEQTALSASNLLKDLQTALKEKHDLAKLIEQLNFEKQDKDAKVLELTSKVSTLTEKLNSAARDIEKFKAEATNQFNGLMGSYEQLKNATDKSFVKISTAKESLEKERGELKQQLKVYRDAIDKNKVSFESLKQRYVTATEQLTKLKRTVSATESMKQSATEALNVKLREERAAKEQIIKQLNISKEKADKLSTALRTANESLIQMTANMFDIDASVLAQRVPTTFSPQQLKSAAEKLANEVVRYSNYNMSGLLTTKEVPQKEEVEESLSSLLGLEG